LEAVWQPSFSHWIYLIRGVSFYQQLLVGFSVSVSVALPDGNKEPPAKDIHLRITHCDESNDVDGEIAILVSDEKCLRALCECSVLTNSIVHSDGVIQ
jgi:hypothetical protein